MDARVKNPAEVAAMREHFAAGVRVREAEARVAGMDEEMLAALDLPRAIEWVRGLHRQVGAAQEAVSALQQETAVLRRLFTSATP
jgi:hypothetical protein